jgi:hypothetical protein
MDYKQNALVIGLVAYINGELEYQQFKTTLLNRNG